MKPLILDFSCLLDANELFENDADSHICSSVDDYKQFINLDKNGDSVVDEFDYEEYLEEVCQF